LSGFGTFDSARLFERLIHVTADRSLLQPRTAIAIVILLSILLLSGAWILDEGAITNEVWGLLLVVPLTIVVVVSIGNRGSGPSESSLSDDWDDEPKEWEGVDVGDPEESGFDVPVL